MVTKSFNIRFIIIFLLIQNTLYCQYQNVLISNQYYPNEVTIMINPKNTNQIVAGSNIYYLSYDSSASGYYYTTNGGYNWSSGIMRSNFIVPYGDPVILVDTAGFFYFVQNAKKLNPWSGDKHLVTKSTNGGANWNNGTLYGIDGKVQDKPWGCVDWSSSSRRNNIYITWTEFSADYGQFDSSIIRFVKSTNGGLNWSTPLRISKRKGDAMDSCNTMEGAVPCTGPNGEIYVSWSGPITLLSGQYGIFFNKSTDGGNTWLDSERVAALQPGGWNFVINGILRCNGFPVTCCDLSNGPHRGTIYINFSDQRNGSNDADIWLIKSTNGGANWSNVKRVNNDPPGKQQFFNWMTIDQSTGYLYIVFYDERNTSTMATNVYLARSTDGGETFQNVRINTSTITLYPYYFIGDYINISAVNGHIRPIWTGTQNTIYTAIIDTFYSSGINKTGEQIPAAFKLNQNYPNPFNAKTKIKFDLKNSEDIELSVYDISGKLVSTLIREYMKAGSYEINFNAENISSGIYFYKISAGQFSDVKRMILIK